MTDWIIPLLRGILQDILQFLAFLLTGIADVLSRSPELLPRLGALILDGLRLLGREVFDTPVWELLLRTSLLVLVVLLIRRVRRAV